MTKIPVGKLKEMIQEMVSEEYKALLEQKVDAAFSLIKEKDKPEFVAWLLRYWFNAAKNQNKPWWPSEEITADNVLEFLSRIDNNFPLSPRQIVDDFFIKKSLAKKITGKAGKELETLAQKAAEEEEKEKTGKKYFMGGEETFKDISKDLELTAAMINKMEKSGMEIILKMVGGKNILDMDEDELDTVLEKVDEIRHEMSFEFAEKLKDANGDIRGFIQSLVDDNILTDVDVRLMQPREVEMLIYLMDKDVDEIAEYLRGDAIRDDNKIKSFQAAVAKKVHYVKRGRPRKEEEAV